MLTDWVNPCGVAYREWEDGRIEVQGAGFPAWDVASAQGQQLQAMWAKWGDHIEASGRQNNIPASWVGAIMYIETGGNPHLCSTAGACGLMQFTPAACRMYGHPDCSFYNDHPEAMIYDAGNLLVLKAGGPGKPTLPGVKGYNGGSACGVTQGPYSGGPGIVNMWGERNYVEKFIRASNTIVALGLVGTASPLGGAGAPSNLVQGAVVAGIAGALAYMFLDLQLGLTDRILDATGLLRKT